MVFVLLSRLILLITLVYDFITLIWILLIHRFILLFSFRSDNCVVFKSQNTVTLHLLLLPGIHKFQTISWSMKLHVLILLSHT